MADVVLIGDSIRMGYEAVVRRELAGVDVWSSEENGGDSRRVREKLPAWAMAHRPKVVHVNCGLHDLKKDFETGTSQVGLDEYRDNVTAILTQLKQEINGTVIWAMTTPVNEQWHHERKGFDRFEADVRAYNAVAGEICAKLGVVINDLYSVVMAAGRDALLNPDGVHFGEAGCEVLGKAVAAEIRKAL